MLAVPLIILIALGMKHLTRGPVYCPNSLSHADKIRIDSATSCEQFINNVQLHNLCHDFRNCKECP